jgi:hypothetical protein
VLAAKVARMGTFLATRIQQLRRERRSDRGRGCRVGHPVRRNRGLAHPPVHQVPTAAMSLRCGAPKAVRQGAARAFADEDRRERHPRVAALLLRDVPLDAPPTSQYFAASSVRSGVQLLAVGFTENPVDFKGELFAARTDSAGLVACGQVYPATPVTVVDPGLATIDPGFPSPRRPRSSPTSRPGRPPRSAAGADSAEQLVGLQRERRDSNPRPPV